MNASRFSIATLALATLALAIFVAMPIGQTRAADPTDSGSFLGSITDAAENLSLSGVSSAIEVSADRMELDYTGGRLAYSGSVVVKHAGMVLRAREIAIEFAPGAKRSLRRITANGDVHIARGQERASGGRAVYDPAKATVTLSDNAKLGSGSNTVEGERVIVHLDSRRAVVESAPAANGSASTGEAGGDSGRVRVVITPDSIGGLRSQGIEELQAPVAPAPEPAPEPAVEPGAVPSPPEATGERPDPVAAPVATPWQRPGRANDR